jgi:hypothetical protein
MAQLIDEPEDQALSRQVDSRVESSKFGTIVLRLKGRCPSILPHDEMGNINDIEVMGPCGNMWFYAIATWFCGISVIGHVVCSGQARNIITQHASQMLCNVIGEVSSGKLHPESEAILSCEIELVRVPSVIDLGAFACWLQVFERP